MRGIFHLPEGKWVFQRKKVDGYGEPFRQGIWRINLNALPDGTMCFLMLRNQEKESVARRLDSIFGSSLRMDGQMFLQAGRALCGLVVVLFQVGQVDGQRIPLLRQIIRTNKKDRSEATSKLIPCAGSSIIWMRVKWRLPMRV